MASITRNKSGSYRIQVCVGRTLEGKQIMKSKSFKYDPTKTEKQNNKAAEEFARKFEDACINGTAATSNAKFQEVAAKYFVDYAPKKLKSWTINTYKSYEPVANKAFGYKPICDIRTTDIQSFINNLCEDGMSKRKEIDPKTGKKKHKNLSAKTVYNYFAYVSSVFKYAVMQGIVYTNPCKGVVLPSKKNKEVEVYSLAEVQKLLDLLQDEPFNRRMVFILAIYCGMRRGEIYGLEWPDIDFHNNTITISRTSLHTAQRGTYTDEPKTEKSKRCIKVADNVMQVLKDYHRWLIETRFMMGAHWQAGDRLFINKEGFPENPNNIENWWGRFCKRTGFRYIKFHSFRHFNATQLIANGTDIKTVSSSLGHSNINTTMDIYAHSIAEQQARAAQALSDVIGINIATAKRA